MSVRSRGLHIDARGALAGRRHRAARPHHGDVGLHLDRQQGIGQRVFLPRTPARVVPDRLRAGRDRLLRAHRAPGEDGLAAADRGRRLAVLRADPRPRARGQRQPPLDPPAGFQFSGLRAGARAHAHLHRELRGASRGRVAQHGDGTHQADGPAGIHGAAAARRAGLRRRLGVVHHRVRHPVHRRRAVALRVDRRGRAGRGGHGAAGDARPVPHGARHLVPQSMGRPVQQRLPADAVADRHRPRRVVRRGPGRERAEALLSTRSAHRLPVRRARRGARPRGGGGHAGAVHRAGVAVFLDRAAGFAREPSFPGLSRRRLRPVVRRPGADQHRREHGCAAHQGPDAAAHELRPFQHDRHARLGGAAAARVSRGHAEHAWHGDRSSFRRTRRIPWRCAERQHEPHESETLTHPHHGRRYRRSRVSGARARAPAARRVA